MHNIYNILLLTYISSRDRMNIWIFILVSIFLFFAVRILTTRSSVARISYTDSVQLFVVKTRAKRD